MAKLVLVRHGESEWNVKGLWTGWTDVPLTEKGRDEARHAGEELKGMQFDQAFTSKLIRAQQTLEEIKKVINAENLPTTESDKLNERSYGIYTGKNKWEVEQQVGNEKFTQIRRSWDYPIPEGESLKQVYDRVMPYYVEHIEPLLKEGKNVLIAAHGNSLRALIKYLENISDENIPHLELATGEVYIYDIDSHGQVAGKEIRGSKTDTH